MKPVYLLLLAISTIALQANVHAQQESLQERLRRQLAEGRAQAPALTTRPSAQPSPTRPTLGTRLAQRLEVTKPSEKPQTGLRIQAGRLTLAEAQHEAELAKAEEAIDQEKIIPTRSTVEKGIRAAAGLLSDPEVKKLVAAAATSPQIRKGLTYLGELALSTYRGFTTKKPVSEKKAEGEIKAGPSTEAVVSLLETWLQEKEQSAHKGSQ